MSHHQSATSPTCIGHLLRHGATESNLANPPILQGQTIDGPLSPWGQTQAEAAANCLHDAPIAAVYSSPLLRAQQTAQAIANQHRLNVQILPELMEIGVGHWERRSWVEIERSEPEAYQRFHANPELFGYPGGENFAQVRDRVLPALQRVFASHLGETIAIIGHNAVNRVALAAMLELPLPHARNLVQENGAISTIHYRSGQWRVHTINSVFHLPQELARPRV